MRALAPAWALAMALAAVVPAQGPLHRENWAHSHLLWRREQLLARLDAAPADARAKVLELLDEPDQGLPFRNVARALALLAGREFDDTLLFRSMLCAFVLPEVVDPDSSREDCRSLNVSVFLPARVQPSGAASFRLVVRDTSGTIVHEGADAVACSLDDLRLAQCPLSVPCADLPDGEYTVELLTEVAGTTSTEGDPRLVHRFAVLRGYQQRAEAATSAAARVAPDASGMAGSSLLAVAAEVSRAYSGEAPHGDAAGREDLLLLERMLARLAKGEDLLGGEQGDQLVGLPTGSARPLSAVLRRPASGKASRLAVVVGGSPFYQVDGPRPGAPATTSPRWTARACHDFGPEGTAVLFVESPGAMARWVEALGGGIEAAQRALGIEPAQTILVVERDAAVAACFGLAALLPRIQSLQLVNGGVLSRTALESLSGREVVAYVPRGLLGRGLVHTRDVAQGSQGPIQLGGRFVWVAMDEHPWQFALPLAFRHRARQVSAEAPR